MLGFSTMPSGVQMVRRRLGLHSPPSQTLTVRHADLAVQATIVADMPGAPTRLTISESEDQTLILVGELDAHSSPQLASSLESLDPARVITLEMSLLEFMDSSGLRVLIEANQRADAASGSLILFEPTRIVSKLLTVSGLDPVLQVKRD